MKRIFFISFLLLWLGTFCFCQEVAVETVADVAVGMEIVEEDLSPAIPAPPGKIEAFDSPDDSGNSVELIFEKSKDDLKDSKVIKAYRIFRTDEKGNRVTLKDLKSWSETYGDELLKAVGNEKLIPSDLKDGKLHYSDFEVTRGTPYRYSVVAVGNSSLLSEEIAINGTVKATSEWVHSGRVSLFVLLVIFFVFIFYFLRLVKKDAENMFVRRIPGIDAIEEAIGRATEMGRPVLFVPGIGDISNIQTIASLLILGDVAEKVAKYSTKLLVPNCVPFVMTVAQEVVKQGFSKSGNPEAYNEDDVQFLTTEQFAYAAGVNGMMLREKPAANLLLGSFFAESLLLAETGFAAGAIQIAGTAEVTQLPFFIAACDYTLIGEELFAASAYLSKDPKILSTLKATDWYKIVLLLLILLGTVMASFQFDLFVRLFEVT